jgi:hypothetical protein
MTSNRNQDNQIQFNPLTNQRRLLLELRREAKEHIDAERYTEYVGNF